MQKNPHVKFLSACWDIIKQNSAKKCLGAHWELGKMISGMCRRTWCGHSRVITTSLSNTMALSWLISCGVCKQLRESFFQSIFSCFSLLGCSWSERFMVFSERPLRFFTVADRDRQGRRHLRFWMRSQGVRPSFVVMTLRFQCCDYFFSSLFLYLFFVLFVKKRIWPGRSTPSPMRRGARSPNGLWSSPFLSSCCSFCSYPLSRQSLPS